MPETLTPGHAPVTPKTITTETPPPVPPTVVGLDWSLPPPDPFTSWCEWATDGWRRAMDGLKAASSGVTEYHVGSRGLHRVSVADQQAIVDQWAKQMEYWCGYAPLPTAMTGRDTACRVIPRDV
jgi:hypothetical protein